MDQNPYSEINSFLPRFLSLMVSIIAPESKVVGVYRQDISTRQAEGNTNTCRIHFNTRGVPDVTGLTSHSPLLTTSGPSCPIGDSSPSHPWHSALGKQNWSSVIICMCRTSLLAIHLFIHGQSVQWIKHHSQVLHKCIASHLKPSAFPLVQCPSLLQHWNSSINTVLLRACFMSHYTHRLI